MLRVDPSLDIDMDHPVAGPSRMSPTTNVTREGSSDEIEEVVHTSRSRSKTSRSRTDASTLHDQAEDEIIEVSAAGRPRRIPRKAATGSTARRAPARAKAPNGTNAKGKGKAVQPETDATILVDESTDEDEPLFVGKSLAKKYTFQSASIVKSDTSSSSSIVITDEIKPKAEAKPKTKPQLKGDAEEKPSHPPLPLLAPVENVKPPPVPAWLGRTSVLLQIPYCVVCRVRWKQVEM